MARKYFGTDGIRGLANGDKLTPDLAMRVGMAAGLKFDRGDHRNRVVIGKDTRRSGYMIENALAAGFTAVGMDVYFLGPMPTPAVAMLTRSLRAEGFPIGVDPDGYNINDKVGSTAPDALRAKVKEVRADIGIALDGDADRVIIVDEAGEVVDGDQLMAVIAQSWHARGTLKANG